MTIADIDRLVDNFVYSAKLMQAAGWAGVGIHAAHGFALSQFFLSPASNQRTDEYGSSPEGRIRLLQRIVIAVREACPAPFIVQVKCVVLRLPRFAHI